MKIGILSFRSRDPEPAIEDHKLVKAAQELGHEALLIPAWECSVEYHGQETVYWNGQPFPSLDVLIPRARFIDYVELHLHLLEILERTMPVLNKSAAIARAKNKIKTLELLKKKSLPVPLSAVINDLAGLSCVKKYPVVLKTPYGTFGNGVHLVHDRDEAEAVLSKYFKRRMASHFIVQEFIEEAANKDTRVFVLGDKVLAAMERQAMEGEFRSNVELGASAQAVTPSKEAADLAIAAVRALGLDYAGVDIIQSSRGPLVLEVNANSGFKTLEEVSGVNVAKALIEYAAQRLH